MSVYTDSLTGVEQKLGRKLDIIAKTYTRIRSLYTDLPDAQLKLYDDLFWNMARLVVSCDRLWQDIEMNGETEEKVWGENTSVRVRDVVNTYTSQCKLLASITKQLDDKLPGGTEVGSSFLKLLDDDD